ncbi:hypothetical protein GDO86_015693 [Hymenochirus boettgeri]|uniref:Uncharacterized protein n=1 Tax=Hymenochirus boettgeri TaxID=247094 RepID=A0A8T2JU02_9PIPI|nr:hypothetical protein GDO86_015693 [Hymenochirus boettgeri]KAG8448716.1 hypothetical protein GDO86_015693 [Hymenochirus boettgeri]
MKTLAIPLNPETSEEQMYINGDENMCPIVGSVNVVPLVHIVEFFDGLSLALAPDQTISSIFMPIQITEEQQLRHSLQLNETIALISEEHLASTSLQQDLDIEEVLICSETIPSVLNVSNISGDGDLLMENISVELFSECSFSSISATEMPSLENEACFETMQSAITLPEIQLSPLPPLMPSPETVLSAAITGPITSTVPIVSKHAIEIPKFNMSEQGESSSLQEKEMYNESLTTSEVVSIVSDHQKKVETLQQRHRRQRSKLEVMEGVVEQLKKDDLISEEKLSFSEMAFFHTSSSLEN